MAFCDSRLVAFIIYLSIQVFLVDARAWDVAVTIGNEVQFFARNGTITGRVKTRDAVDLAGIAYDDSTRLMYLSDTRNTNLTIFTKNLTTKDFEMKTLHKRQNRTSIIGLVYDTVSQSLFWTDAMEQGIVKMFTNETFSSEPVVLLKLPHKLPRGISLDACNRRLYWANSNRSHPSIESSNLDGSNSTIVISKNLYEPLGVTVDHSAGKLYWIDDEEGVYYKIERSNLDGTDRELLVHGRHQQPFNIAVDREKIYWTDWTYSAIWSMSKYAKAGEVPTEWVSFHNSNRDSDPKSVITRDNIGTIANCERMKAEEKANTGISSTILAEDEDDNLVTSTEEGGSVKETFFKCLNGGIHDETSDICHCKPGFDGSYCERSMCHNYCIHGECFITPGGQPRCKCGPSFQGPRCETNICTGHCLNDGYCSMKNGEPFCACKTNTRGSRCEDVSDLVEICSMFCASGLDSLRSIDTSLCGCPNGTRTLADMNAYSERLWCNTMIITFSTLLGLLAVTVAVLSYYVNKLRRRPRIRKRFVVSKSGITPLTARPQLPSDQCEIMIENCCNMNICETPCFEPKLRSSESHNHKKDEKNSLLDNMDGNSC